MICCLIQCYTFVWIQMAYQVFGVILDNGTLFNLSVCAENKSMRIRGVAYIGEKTAFRTFFCHPNSIQIGDMC